MEKIILNHQQIERKITRIAYQIFEKFNTENEIILAGISQNGYTLAEKINIQLQKISNIQVKLCEVIIDKKNPLAGIKSTLTPDDYKDKCVVLVDDVLNTGSTLIYGVKHFLDVPLKNFKTVVLVDRNHKKYPVKVDFKGISLSTNDSDQVKVEFTEESNYAYLIV